MPQFETQYNFLCMFVYISINIISIWVINKCIETVKKPKKKLLNPFIFDKKFKAASETSSKNIFTLYEMREEALHRIFAILSPTAV